METNLPETEAAVRKPARMEWLDAMRGFTMILVVANHVSTIGFGDNIKTSAALSFFVLFRMPLFFFISGFLAYKSSFLWTGRSLTEMLWKKFRIQVFPTVIFLLVALALLAPDFAGGMMYALKSPTKYGYWFTWVLLQMFALYYVFSYLEARLSPRRRMWPIAVLWAVSLAVYATLYMPAWFSYHKAPFFQYSSLVQTMMYFHFFLFGNIVRRYWDRAQRLMDSGWFLPVVLAVAFFCVMDTLKWHTLRLQWANLPRTASMYLLLTLVIMYFRHYGEAFTGRTRLGRGLQYIGVRTLDIYLIHYLFIPHVGAVGAFFNSHRGNFVFDTLVSVGAALLVIGFCLVTSNLLRISPWLRLHLFGRK